MFSSKIMVLSIILASFLFSLSLSMPIFASTYTLQNPAGSNFAFSNSTFSNYTAGNTSPLSQFSNSVSDVSSMSVKTDLPSYKYGDTIVVTGHIPNLQNSSAITIRVSNPSLVVISFLQLFPSLDGSFIHQFLAAGPLWSESGTYSINVQYGLTTMANTTFNYIVQASTLSTTTSSSSPTTSTTTSSPPTPTIPTTIPSTPSKIPNWVKGVFNYYVQGNLSDDDLIKALQFLIQQGIIKVS